MSNNKLTYSSELMTNYLQSVVVSPQKKFQALQTSDGNALLFSIGTDDVFYLNAQTPGSKTGWQQYDLSSILSPAFSNQKVTAKTFAAAQNAQTGNIDLALVVTFNKTDYLYLSLNHGNQTGAIKNDTIQWSVMAYDDPRHAGITLNITNVYMAQSKSGEYIVVDISRDTFTPPSDFVERYYIDPAKTNGKVWNNMVIGGDLDPVNDSIIGRKSGDRVDGTYTLGSINGTTELIYAPLYNAWNPVAPPTITRLTVPAGASAIAAIRKSDGSTDLFVAGNGSLYYFASDKQQDGASGVSVVNHVLLDDVEKLYASAAGNDYVVWGLNRDDEIFYMRCAVNNITSGGWSFPVPIMDKVEQVTPYINLTDNSNVFFAVTGSLLTKAVQSPATTLWSFQQIHLQAPVQAATNSYHSYTTRLQLADDKNQVVANTPLYISTNAQIPVYINNVYYVLNSVPIPVVTDNMGSLTVIELVDDLPGTLLTVSESGGTPVIINTMDNAFQKSVSLDTPDKLKAARVYNDDGSNYALIPQGTSDDDLKSLASANVQLASAYTSVTAPKTAKKSAAMMATPTLKGFEDSVLVEIGDLFSWLESGIEHVIQLVEDVASGFWYLVVKIGEDIYHGLLDCVEKVVGAVKWLYNAVKVAFEDLMKFLSFLFEWDDIKRTQKVIKNITKVYLNDQVDQIEVFKEEFDKQIQNLITLINGWSGVSDFKGLGDAAGQPVNTSSTPTEGMSAPTTLLSYHFQNNAQNISNLKSLPANDPPQNPIDTLFAALKKEGVILDDMIDQFEQLTNEYTTMSLEEILKRIIGILSDTVLLSAQNVVDALLDILYEMAKLAVQALDTPIHIPVLSDILEAIGIPDFSLLDLLSLIAAVPVTIGYKLVHGTAPFPDNNDTSFLINATSLAQIKVALQPPQAARMSLKASVSGSGSSTFSLSQSVAGSIFIAGHVASGFFTIMSDFISTFEAMAPTGENPFGTPSAVLGVLSAVTAGAASFLVPKDPIKNTVVSWISTGTTAVVILAKIVFSGPAQSKFAASTGIMKNLAAGDGRATGAIVNSILIIPALFCTVWHFVELAETDSDHIRSAAIIDETASVTSYISRLSYAIAVNDPDEETRLIPVAVMAVANVATGGLQIAEAVVG